MTPIDLKSKIESHFDVHAVDRFACALRVERRSVYRWLDGSRKIPRYVKTVFELLESCPPEVLPERWRI